MKRTGQLLRAGTPSAKKGRKPISLRGVGKPKREWTGGVSGLKTNTETANRIKGLEDLDG